MGGRQGSSGSNTRMGRGQRPNRGNPVARNGKSKKNRKGGAIGEVFGVLKDKIGVLKDKGIELLKGQLDKIGKPRNRGGDGRPGPPGMPPAGIESGNDGSSETSPQEPPVKNYPQNHERGPPVGENNDVQNAVAQTSQEADYEDENFPVETPQIRDGNVLA